MTIRTMQSDDWPSVKTIYEQGIATGHATFQTTAPPWEEWDDSHIKKARLVAVDEGTVIGWAALTPVSGRCVYAGVAEVSVYVSPEQDGKGIGKALLKALVEESEVSGLWTLQAGIFPENKASLNIHEANGFRIIGIREKIGKMNNQWRDTMLLERRSQKIGL